MRIKLFILAIIIAAAGLAVYFKIGQPEAIKKDLPPAKTYQQIQPEPVLPDSSLPAEVNLAIPFTSQAPFKVWDEPHEEFCEEASVLMASHYILGLRIPNPEYADEQLFKIKDWEEKNLGYYKDTTAQETSRILKEYFGISKVAIVRDPTLMEIKQAVFEGKAVLIPAAGRQLPNPNFRSPGPLYHMLVVKGYTKDGQIITNDPGTRLGADFIYEPEALLNAMHDWNNGDVEHGAKVIIIVG